MNVLNEEIKDFQTFIFKLNDFLDVELYIINCLEKKYGEKFRVRNYYLLLLSMLAKCIVAYDIDVEKTEKILERLVSVFYIAKRR